MFRNRVFRSPNAENGHNETIKNKYRNDDSFNIWIECDCTNELLF